MRARRAGRALNGIVEFEAELLVRERDRQDLGDAVPHPDGVVEAHRHAAVRLAELRQHGAQELRQVRVALGHAERGFGREPLDGADIEPVRLPPPAYDAKAPPAQARQAEQAVRQLVKIHDRRERADFEVCAGPTSCPSRISTTPKPRSPRMQLRTMST